MLYYFAAHRNQTYPHAPRKPLLTSMKRKDSKDSTRTQSFETSVATSSPSSTTTGTPISSPQKSVPHVIVSDEEAVVSERAAGGPHSDSDTDDRRVQFNKKQKEINDNSDAVEENDSYGDNHDETKKKIRG